MPSGGERVLKFTKGASAGEDLIRPRFARPPSPKGKVLDAGSEDTNSFLFHRCEPHSKPKPRENSPSLPLWGRCRLQATDEVSRPQADAENLRQLKRSLSVEDLNRPHPTRPPPRREG